MGRNSSPAEGRIPNIQFKDLQPFLTKIHFRLLVKPYGRINCSGNAPHSYRDWLIAMKLRAMVPSKSD